jgi:hypothetical protein
MLNVFSAFSALHQKQLFVQEFQCGPNIQSLFNPSNFKSYSITNFFRIGLIFITLLIIFENSCNLSYEKILHKPPIGKLSTI